MIVFIRKYTIPDGRDIWMIDNLGNVVDYIECDDYDCIHIVDGEGNILSSSNYYEPGTISELCLDGQSNTSFSVCGFDNAKEIFEFLAGQYTNSNGMPLEWAHGTIVEKSLLTLSSDNNTNIITTTHEKASVNLDVWLDNDFVISRQAHNHPSGRKYPSNITASNGIRHGDVPTALIFEKIYLFWRMFGTFNPVNDPTYRMSHAVGGASKVKDTPVSFNQ